MVFIASDPPEGSRTSSREKRREKNRRREFGKFIPSPPLVQIAQQVRAILYLFESVRCAVLRCAAGERTGALRTTGPDELNGKETYTNEKCENICSPQFPRDELLIKLTGS